MSTAAVLAGPIVIAAAVGTVLIAFGFVVVTAWVQAPDCG